MSSTFSNNGFSVSIFGESHGAGIGVVIDAPPAGEVVDLEEIKAFMKRRAPRKDGTSTLREEGDVFEILSGLYNSKTTGTPLTAIIRNKDQHSSDYNGDLLRPGHADYTGKIRYKNANDFRGGGHFSGRLTAPLCFAGAVCGQILSKKGITTGAHIASIGEVRDNRFDAVNITSDELIAVRNRYLPLVNAEIESNMREAILKASEDNDSIGGIIECCAVGVKAGIGSPMFGGLENIISQAVFGIPAIKAIEFGAGFEVANLKGSENNDEFYINNGEVLTKTNNCGGILGGISSGAPIVFRVAVKPVPSISKLQNTVDYASMKEAEIAVKGRHDPCVVPRAVPAVEAALNIALLSFMI